MEKMVFKYITYVICILSTFVSVNAIAVDKNWVTGDNSCNVSSWDNLVCWGPTGQPLDGDDAYLTQADGVHRTVTYSNAINPVPKLQSLTINATGTGTMTLLQSQGTVDATTEFIGFDGSGVYSLSGGENVVNELYLGYTETGGGIYNLSGTGNLVAGNEIISRHGGGTFNQSGGSNTASYIAIASSDGSDTSGVTGTYNMSDGSLSVVNLDIASSGFPGVGATGVFNQTGGSVTVDNRLNLADDRDASGTYNLSMGDLEVGELGLWDMDQTGITGVFNQTGGTVTTGQIVSTWFGFNYNLDGGSLTTDTINLQADGQFNHTGGNNVVDELYLGYTETGGGIYNLSGTGNLVAGNEIISRHGGGTFNQSGGSNTASYIAIASSDGSDTSGVTGTYNMSDGSLSVVNLDIASSGFPGVGATGVFNQTGGSVTVDNRLNLADDRDASGTYNLSMGDLEVGELGLWDVDQTGITGVFNQTGGAVTTDQIVNTFFGFTYNLDGGNLKTESIELQDEGEFNHSGGTNTISDTMTLINSGTSSGRYTLSGGTLDANNIIIARDETFIFNGGTLSVNNFTGNLVNNGGTLSPGKSPGKTTVNGNYTQLSNGVFEVEIGGLAQGSEYDWLDITGNASLDGTLEVSLFDLGSGTFTLGEGDVFDILSAETITGEFDLLSLVTLDEDLEWDISYLTDVSGTSDLVRLSVNKFNELPVADAGPDQIVNESDAVNLDGTDSDDLEDGRIVTYAWTQTAGEPTILSGASTATPSFAAPETTSTTTLTFSLIVTDSGGKSSIADTVDIEVLNINGLPLSNAGVDQIVNEGASVALDGQASSDSDGVIEKYNWIQTAGNSVELSDATAEMPTFTAPSVTSDTVLVFSLEVTDTDGDTDTDSVKVTVSNTLVADAGVDQQVSIGDVVRLNGLNSLGVSEITSYQWTQTEGPMVNLSKSDSASASFTAPSIGETTLLVFKLMVTDSTGSQGSDTIFINVRDELLTVKSPLDIQLINTVTESNMSYQFDTESDPFIDSTDIQWRQTGGPAVILNGSNTKVPSFEVPTVSADSVATFEVRSEDIDGVIIRANVRVNILGTESINQQPIANTGSDLTVVEGETVFLNATGSMDVDGSITGYYWQQSGGPMVLLNSITEAQPSFVAPSIAAVDDGTRIDFELVVTDNQGFVDYRTASITVLDNGITAFSDEVTAIISTSGEPIGIEPIDDGSLVALDVVDPNTITDDVNRPESLPYGMLDFSLRVEPGATVSVNIVLPTSAGSDFTWWKYSSDNGWQDYSANTTFNAARDIITITLTDNGEGDDDPTPGVIRDPGGLAPASASATGGGSNSSGSGGVGSIGPFLLVILLMSFYARVYIRLKSLNLAVRY